MDKLVRPLVLSVCVLVFSWILLFGFFVMDALSFRDVSSDRCDNIVVLTGGRNRINHALRTISENNSKNLFISGVYAKTSLDDIIDSKQQRKDVNFILDKRARNTFENAEEIDSWVSANNIDKIILVTSDYHMRRGILVLRNENRHLKIIPCASKSKFDLVFLKLCTKEFHKTLYVCAKILLNKVRFSKDRRGR